MLLAFMHPRQGWPLELWGPVQDIFVGTLTTVVFPTHLDEQQWQGTQKQCDHHLFPGGGGISSQSVPGVSGREGHPAAVLG